MKRVEGVDALRGLLACGVMLYHFMSWAQVPFFIPFEHFFSAMAVSFVETFFVISGFSLFYVYNEKMGSVGAIKRFYARRFFRIAPLFYFLLVIVVGLKLVAYALDIDVNRPLDFHLFFMNVTFLFGLIWPPDSLLVAGWSVGVEMAIYLFFPLIALCCRNIYVAVLLCLLSLLGAICYSYYFLESSVSFSDQWGYYTFFVNHLLFFIGGIVVYFSYKLCQEAVVRLPMFIAFLVVLFGVGILLLLASEDARSGLIGNARYGLFVVSLCCVLLFAICELKNIFLIRLGDLSYSIYLGHFFVFLVVDRLFDDWIPVIGLSIIGVYIFASATHEHIEKPMIKFGKRVV